MTDHSQDRDVAQGPEDTLREGALKATIWRNEGEKGPYRTTEYTRSYRDRDGQWQETHSMREVDNLPLRHLSGRAHDRVTELKIAEREQRLSQQQQRKPDIAPQL